MFVHGICLGCCFLFALFSFTMYTTNFSGDSWLPASFANEGNWITVIYTIWLWYEFVRWQALSAKKGNNLWCQYRTYIDWYTLHTTVLRTSVWFCWKARIFLMERLTLNFLRDSSGKRRTSKVCKVVVTAPCIERIAIRLLCTLFQRHLISAGRKWWSFIIPNIN